MAGMGPRKVPNTGRQVGGHGGGARGDTGSQSTWGPGGRSPLSRTLRSHGGMRAMLPDGQGNGGGSTKVRGGRASSSQGRRR